MKTLLPSKFASAEAQNSPNKRIYPKVLAAGLLLTSYLAATQAMAAVSAEEAAKLNTTLTPFGAEVAGNSDGTIPAWTSELTLPDSYSADQSLFTITGQNYQQYADKLTLGQKALFEKYPDTFQMKVYPTFRSHTLPDWMYSNIADNAVKATLSEGAKGISGAHAGVPFPIPTNGAEAIWNHLVRWRGSDYKSDYKSFVVYPNSSISETELTEFWEFPYFDASKEAGESNELASFMRVINAPVRRKGEITLGKDPVNFEKESRRAWQYIPGQRRVRRAPSLGFDTPDSDTSNTTVVDEGWMYNGSPERYNWTLKGKQEMFVPYNEKVYLTATQNGKSTEEVFNPNHPNPELRRWELHRVWVVEGELKDGKRHVYQKRRFYIDEDSWNALLSESYDSRGKLWKVAYAAPDNFEGMPGAITRGYVTHDLLSGIYAVDVYSIPTFYKGEGAKFFTPQNVRKMARR